MEDVELPLTNEKEFNANEEDELFKCKEYELLLNREKIKLTMKINPEEVILFKVKNKNNLYLKEYKYNELIKTFLLVKDYYNNINKVFNFLDISFSRKKISLLDDKDQTIIKLKLKKNIDYDKVDCYLYLKLFDEQKEQMDKLINNNIDYKNIYESIKKENEKIKESYEFIKKENNEIKVSFESIKKENEKIKENYEFIKKENNDIKISIESIKKENEKIKESIEPIKNENNRIKANIESIKKENREIKASNEKLKDDIEILKKDNEKMGNNYKFLLNMVEENVDKENENEENDIKENDEIKNNKNENKHLNEIKKYSIPLKFQYVEYIIKDSKNLVDFYVFNRINDSAQYLSILKKVKYDDEKFIFNLIIMKMANNENIIIQEIDTNFTEIYDIKYHSDKDKNEYLYVSGEYLYIKKSIFYSFKQYNIKVIAFDIKDDFNEKFFIDISDYIDCKSILLLFDIFKKNYILVSYYKDKFSKLYDYQKNDSFIKNIDGTNNYESNKMMIPWNYKNKWYIIDINYEKIYIKNLLTNGSYAELKFRGVGSYLSGFLYKDKFLYVYTGNWNSEILIWNLDNKKMIKIIELKEKIQDMFLWDNKYAIIFSDYKIKTFDMENHKIINNDSIKYYENKNETKYNNFKSFKKIKLNDIGAYCLIFQNDSGLYLYKSE